MSGKNLVDGCKAKGATYRALVEKVTFVETCPHDCPPNALNFVIPDDPLESTNLELPTIKYGPAELSPVIVEVEVGH